MSRVAIHRYRGSPAERFFNQLKDLNFVETILVFAASLLLSVLPMIILLSSFAGHRIDTDITRHIGLNRQGARIVGQLFQSSHNHPLAAIVSGLVVAVAGSVGVAGSLKAIYERSFGLAPLKMRPGQDALRCLVWVAAMFGLLGADSSLDATLAGVPGRFVAIGAFEFFGTAVFFWWSMHFLLVGRISWRELLPSAVAVAVLWILLEVFSALYLASSIVSDSRTYGTIGVIFDLMTWFIAIGAVIVLGTALGSAWPDRRGRPGRAVRSVTPSSG